MAVAFDAATNATAASNVSSLGWDHSVGTITNGIIIIGAASGSSTALDSSDVPTVDGNNCSLILFRTRDASGGGTAWRLGGWYRVLGSVSAGTLAVSVPAGGNVQVFTGGSMTFSGVHQSTPIGDTDGEDSAGTPDPGTTGTAALTASAGDMVVDFLCQNAQAARDMTRGGSQTERVDCFSSEGGTFPWLKGSSAAGAASVTMSWGNTSGAVNWSHIAFVLQQAAAGGSTPNKSLLLGVG